MSVSCTLTYYFIYLALEVHLNFPPYTPPQKIFLGDGCQVFPFPTSLSGSLSAQACLGAVQQPGLPMATAQPGNFIQGTGNASIPPTYHGTVQGW